MSTLDLRSSSASPRKRQSPPPPQKKPGSALRRLWLPAVVLLGIAAGGLTGVVLAHEIKYSSAADEVKALATYRPSVISRVYADDGETVIGEFALERRIPLRYNEIPPNIRNAILAVEDARFYEHAGIDPIRIAGALYKNVTTGSREGGSTLTQQLVKNLFLSRAQTYTRKLSEQLMALQIERFYTKNQIMEMYVNHIFLGARAYGFEAAAETYFGKKAKDLTLDEAALLAGIPRSTTKYNPTLNPEDAKERRNLVLELMAKNEFITQSEAAAAKARPVKVVDTAYYEPPSALPGFGYPVEEIRQYLEDKYSTRVALGGVTVYSTINIEAQRKANEAVRTGLRQYDRARGWRSDYPMIVEGDAVPTKEQIAAFTHPDWFGNRFEKDTYVPGLITEVDQRKNEATARFGNYTAIVTTKEMGWSGRLPRSEFKPGMMPEFKIKEVDDTNRRLTVELSQVPLVQGALHSMNAKTGEVVAMVGGYDFSRNKFNNATQANRQTGSCFKPFVYAAAVEWGLKPESIVSGAPIRRGNWQPHNYDGSLGHGDVPMKTALAKSLNLAAVHLLDMVGIQTGSQMVRRFGIKNPMAPYLPSALGATEVPLEQMVSAYSAFPNKGVRVQPHLIRRVLDRDLSPLEEWKRTTYKVTSEYVALTMVDMMRAVTSGGGTAPQATAIGHQVAGKTGTVNDQTDVWFIGYTPTYVTGVWMGFPEKRSLGAGMTGGRGALPIFVDYMKVFMKDKEKETFPKTPKMPEDIKELAEQRQREQAEEREAETLAFRISGGRRANTNRTSSAATSDGGDAVNLEQITLPPPVAAEPGTPGAAGSDKPVAPPPPPPSATTTTPPPAATTRPREVEPPKRKGKKGEDEP